MKKSCSTFIKIILCAIMAISVVPIVGCKAKVKDTKTLFIGNFNGGVGSAWLNVLKDEFIKENPECSIQIRNKREQYNGDALLSNIVPGEETMYFTTEVSYEQMTDRGLLEDITSIVEAPIVLPDGTKEDSIETKMDENLRGYFKRIAGTNTEAKYYAVPFFTAIYGIVYDRTLFEDRNLLATSTNNMGYLPIKITNNPDPAKNITYDATVGPDFIAGTYDDGLPRTWEDTKILMKTMRTGGITPFTWAGTGYEYYRRAFERAVWASYEGYNDYMLNFSFNGTDNTIGEINEKNAYRLHEQEGKLASIILSKDIAGNTDNYSSSVFFTSQTHTRTHNTFLDSKLDGTSSPIAMMLEGGWWENETRDSGFFRDMAKEYGPEYDYGKRDLRVMPIPKFIGTSGLSDQSIDETTLYSDGNTMAFIKQSASDEQKMWATKFLQFVTRNKSLSTFTRITGVARPFEYTLLPSDYETLTPFCKSMWDVFSAPNSKLTTSYNVSKLRFTSASAFADWDFGTKLGKREANDPLQFFSPYGPDRDGNASVSAQDYFDGIIAKHNKEWWDTLT